VGGDGDRGGGGGVGEFEAWTSHSKNLIKLIYSRFTFYEF
jgi:hypothetical protein